jgi:hypothetical protein
VRNHLSSAESGSEMVTPSLTSTFPWAVSSHSSAWSREGGRRRWALSEPKAFWGPRWFGVKLATTRALVQGVGPALRMAASELSRELVRVPAPKEALNFYLHELLCQLAQSVACARFHQTAARLASYLLMTRDRAGSDSFFLTQEFIARLMGVRRVTITVAAASLQKQKLIRYARGNVTVLNGVALEALSCGCYAVDKHMHARLVTTAKTKC